MHPTRDQITARLAPGADVPTIDACVPMSPEGIDADASGLLVSLTYATADAHATRVSADVDALSALPGYALTESWSSHAAPLSVHLRYAPAPAAPRAADVPQPIAPRPIAPVPATPSRRR